MKKNYWAFIIAMLLVWVSAFAVASEMPSKWEDVPVKFPSVDITHRFTDEGYFVVKLEYGAQTSNCIVTADCTVFDESGNRISSTGYTLKYNKNTKSYISSEQINDEVTSIRIEASLTNGDSDLFTYSLEDGDITERSYQNETYTLRKTLGFNEETEEMEMQYVYTYRFPSVYHDQPQSYMVFYNTDGDVVASESDIELSDKCYQVTLFGSDGSIEMTHLDYFYYDENGDPVFYSFQNNGFGWFDADTMEKVDFTYDLSNTVAPAVRETTPILTEKLIIPEGTVTIEDQAFEDCTSVQMVYIPRSVTSIGDHTFDGCLSAQICCFEDSYAYAYAVEHGISVKAITEWP